MSYFSNFPVILDYKIQGTLYDGIDITRRTSISADVKNNPNAYLDYVVKEGETPEMIADRVYDDENLYWVIMMFNDRFDVNGDWPMDQVSFERYVNRVYGDQVHSIRFYVSAASGMQVNADWDMNDRIPVTNYEYETALNERKRRVKIPLPQYAVQISKMHNRLVKR